MACIFSWKITNGKYCYLIPDGNGSYIRGKITAADELQRIAKQVDGMGESAYEAAFNKMKAEVNSIYGENTISGNYGEYYNYHNITGAAVALLSGKDGGGKYGGGGGAGGEGGGGSDYFLDETDWRTLLDKIEDAMEKERGELEDKIKALKDEIAALAGESVGDALDRIGDAIEELEQMKKDLKDAAEGAQGALDEARELFQDGEITSDDIINVLRNVRPFGEWYSGNSGNLITLLTDYNTLSESMGSYGEAVNAGQGAFSQMGAYLNTLSGHVGTVQSEMNASMGKIEHVATWYDEYAQSMTELKSYMDGKRGVIEQLANYVKGDDLATQISRQINAQAGTITDSINSQNNGNINSIQQQINGIQARIDTTITSYNGMQGRLSEIESQLNAGAQGDQANYEQAVRIAQEALTKANEMRETWSENSGMVRTVSDLFIKRDDEGIPIYYYLSGYTTGTGDNEEYHKIETRVYYIGQNNNKELTFTNNKNNSQNPPDENWKTKNHLETWPNNTGYKIYLKGVYPEYLVGAMSYIQQTSNGINMAVSRDDIKAAIELSVEDDASKIYLGADSILLDGQVIADSLTAKEANVGGVHIGKGQIYADNSGGGGGKWAITSAGTISATSVDIKGTIRADQLILGDAYGGDGSLTGFVNNYVSSLEGVTSEEVDAMIAERATVCGWTVTDMGDGYVRVDTTIGGAESSFTISNSGLMIAKNGIFSGTVFATNGVFNGKVYAKEGEFAGSISANSGYFKGSLSADSGYFKGSLSADSGYFKGRIEASDIFLEGKSLKMFSAATNTFEIGNDRIDIMYVPETVQFTFPNTYGPEKRLNTAHPASDGFNSDTGIYAFASFSATGNTVNTIPYATLKFNLQINGAPPAGGPSVYGPSFVAHTKYCVFSGDSTNNYSDGYFSQGKSIPESNKWIYGNDSNFGRSISTTNEDFFHIPLDGNNYGMTNKEIGCISGRTYYVVIKIQLEFTFSSYYNGQPFPYTLYTETSINDFINTPYLNEQQFFRIGSNGMQICLGTERGLYFTAAKKYPNSSVPSAGGIPIIAMGGKAKNGKMYGLKLDEDGIKILRGDNNGWVSL